MPNQPLHGAGAMQSTEPAPGPGPQHSCGVIFYIKYSGSDIVSRRFVSRCFVSHCFVSVVLLVDILLLTVLLLAVL